MYKSLENKIKSRQFAVIRRRYSPQEVPGRGIHNVIALAMSICVAFSNKVMDTPELPLPIKRHEAPKYDICSVGRSMIEMLGVLAIIAVLSVGGIAGYSKAMEKWKVNKAIGEYNYLIQGLLEHFDDFNLSNSEEDRINLGNVFMAVGLIPSNWSGGDWLNDSIGNQVYIFSQNGLVVMSIKIGGLVKDENNLDISTGFSPVFCRELFFNIAKPLSSEIYDVYVFLGNSRRIDFFGSKYCDKTSKCLNNIALAEIDSACKSCENGKASCDVSFVFK